jgi:hypothetical protein
VPGPGQYLPDPTAGITNPRDLPQAKIVRRSRNFQQLSCPQCGKACFRNRTRTRVLHDVGDLVTGRPRDIQPKIGDLFAQRYLFVQHDLTPAQRRTVHHITRGVPQLRTLRTIMEEVYRLFDRPCRTDTALAKLAQLRQRVRRYKHVGNILHKLQSPHLEKALTFLDDQLLPSTSNAVERGKRRHRKLQKTVYRIRTQKHLHNRIALDMLRDLQKDGRTDTLQTLHRERANSGINAMQ